MNDAIRVHHGHNLEHELLPQIDRDGIFAEEKFEDALHYPGAHCLARVLPGDDDYGLFVLSELYLRVLGYYHVLATIVSNGLRKISHSKVLRMLLHVLNGLYKLH